MPDEGDGHVVRAGRKERHLEPTGPVRAGRALQPGLLVGDHHGRVGERKALVGDHLSPDGARIVVSLNEGALRRLWIGRVDQEPLIPLTQGPDDVFNTFSADGTWVAFTRYANGRYNIFRVRTDGSGTIERLSDSDKPQGQPELHPTSNLVVFNYAEGQTEMHIWGTAFAPPGRQMSA